MLDLPYIEKAGRAIRHWLQQSQSCELAYRPDRQNESLVYPLVFTPVGQDGIHMNRAADIMDGGIGSSVYCAAFDGEDGWVLVSMLSRGAWNFRLLGDNPHIPSAAYIEEHLTGPMPVQNAIRRLFVAISVDPFGTVDAPAAALHAAG